MFTQMVVDQDHDNDAFATGTFTSEDGHCDKLQTIMEGGSDISSRFMESRF